MIAGSHVNQGIRLLTESVMPTKSVVNAPKTERNSSFEAIFKSYVDLYEQTNVFQNHADKLQLDYASGKTNDMVALNLALEKASASLNFTIQVTNKVLSAYQEIMRMQI